jgi:hypothetical protein
MRTMPPVGQRDLGDLVGDPFLPAETPLHDRPDAARVQAVEDAVDQELEARIQAGLQTLGPPPDSLPAYLAWLRARDEWRATMTQDIYQKPLIGGQVIPADADLSELYGEKGHGLPMPTTVQGALDSVSGSDFEAADAQRALGAETAESLWDDMLIAYPDSRDDPAAVQRAAQEVVNELRSRGVADVDRYIRRNRGHFLEAVHYWSRNVTYSTSNDDGRTAGLSGYGANSPGSYVAPEPEAHTEDLIREMQRARGW